MFFEETDLEDTTKKCPHIAKKPFWNKKRNKFFHLIEDTTFEKSVLICLKVPYKYKFYTRIKQFVKFLLCRKK